MQLVLVVVDKSDGNLRMGQGHLFHQIADIGPPPSAVTLKTSVWPAYYKTDSCTRKVVPSGAPISSRSLLLAAFDHDNGTPVSCSAVFVISSTWRHGGNAGKSLAAESQG